MNLVIKKVDNNNDEVLTFLALQVLEMFFKNDPELKNMHKDNQEYIESFIDRFKQRQALKQSTFYVAFMFDEIIGVGQLVDKNYIAHLFVTEKYQNQLIGTQILERLINECNKNEVVRVDAKIEAISLYERFSFHKIQASNDNMFVSMELERDNYGK